MIKKYSCLAFMLILSISFISAEIGISGPYSKNFPLTMGSGQTIATYFKIQNTIGNTTDITVETILEEGSEIVTIVNGPIYEIPAGGEATSNLRIKIPNSIEAGTEYNIKLLFKPTTESSLEGMVQFAVNINREFKVIVENDYSKPLEASETEKDTETRAKPNILFLIILSTTILSIMLIIILLIVHFVRRKNIQQTQDYHSNPKT